MATRKRARKASKNTVPSAEISPISTTPPADNITETGGVETTGRFIVIFKEGATDPKKIKSTLSDIAGIKDITTSSDYPTGAIDADDLAESDVVQFEKLGVAVCSAEQDIQALAAAAADADSPILAIEPEYLAHPSAEVPLEYLRGYRDAVNQLYNELAKGGTTAAVEAELAAVLRDTSQFTWGLQATKVSTSPRSGQGIKVAVLDTGFDLQHPDFRGRAITSQSFVSGVSVQDIHGHGTHCIGTALGPQLPSTGVRRYGVAFGAQIFVGKVFNNRQPRPSAATGNVIAGIEWAMTNGCRVVSMSLGVAINQKIQQYETPIRRALEAGTLVVAAAGNNAERPQNPGFVEPPANADAAMAVAAIDNRLRIAEFSARSSAQTGVGGLVNIAAPGVDVFSSLPVSRGGHGLLNGTSMATPHVAGIAALWAQATGESGIALWNRLVQTVRPLSLASADVGSGLVQAPQS
jgi:subtilisin family serine protease